MVYDAEKKRPTFFVVVLFVKYVTICSSIWYLSLFALDRLFDKAHTTHETHQHKHHFKLYMWVDLQHIIPSSGGIP